MKERTVKREVKTKVHVAETGSFVVEVLEDERGELHIRKRKMKDDPATEKFAWQYSGSSGEWSSDSYYGNTGELAERARDWSPEFDARGADE